MKKTYTRTRPLVRSRGRPCRRRQKYRCTTQKYKRSNQPVIGPPVIFTWFYQFVDFRVQRSPPSSNFITATPSISPSVWLCTLTRVLEQISLVTRSLHPNDVVSTYNYVSVNASQLCASFVRSAVGRFFLIVRHVRRFSPEKFRAP